MTFFLVTGIPIFLALILVVYFPGAFDWRMILKSAGKGILWFFPAVLLHVFITSFFPHAYEGVRLYFVRLFRDLVLPLVLGIGAYAAAYRRDLISPGEYQFIRLVSFLGGYFTLFAQYAVFSFHGWYEGYLFFLLPFQWMILMLFSGFALGGFFSVVQRTRYLYLLCGASMPFLLGWVSYLYQLNYRLPAWFLILALFGGTLASAVKGIELIKK